jgi:hypothetical protein
MVVIRPRSLVRSLALYDITRAGPHVNEGRVDRRSNGVTRGRDRMAWLPTVPEVTTVPASRCRRRGICVAGRGYGGLSGDARSASRRARGLNSWRA